MRKGVRRVFSWRACRKIPTIPLPTITGDVGRKRPRRKKEKLTCRKGQKVEKNAFEGGEEGGSQAEGFRNEGEFLKTGPSPVLQLLQAGAS